MMMKIGRITLVLFFAMAISGVFAQGGGEDGFDQTQIITGDRSLEVQKALKMSVMPEPIEIKVDLGSLKYQMVPRRPATEIAIDSIEPAKVKVREPLEKLYNGYVKAGAGTFATPYLEAVYTSTRDRDLAYGVHLHHLSSHDGVNRPVAFSGFNENLLEGWVKKIYKKHSLQTKLGYQRNGVHYYGFDPQDLDFDNKDIRQTFDIIDLNAQWRSYYRDSSRINHVIDLDAYYLGDRYESNEFGIKAGANLQAIRGDLFYNMDASFDFLSTSFGSVTPFEFMNDTLGLATPESDGNNAILELAPQVLLVKDKLSALVGLSIYGQFSNQAKFHAFPNLEVSYSLFDDIFIPYAGLTGSVRRASYRTLSTENPYMLSTVLNENGDFGLRNEVVKYDFYGGFRGSISDNMSFNAQASFRKVDNTALYVNDTIFSVENRFALVYDDVKSFTLLGELTYRNSEKWSAGLRAEIFSYTTDKEDEAWQLPSHRIAANGTYNLFDKFVIGAELAWIGKRQVKSFLPVGDTELNEGGYYPVELDGYVDLSLSVEYRYTKRLSAFIEANNLTASKYDIYYRFPAQRVFVLGGLKYAF